MFKVNQYVQSDEQCNVSGFDAENNSGLNLYWHVKGLEGQDISKADMRQKAIEICQKMIEALQTPVKEAPVAETQ